MSAPTKITLKMPISTLFTLCTPVQDLGEIKMCIFSGFRCGNLPKVTLFHPESARFFWEYTRIFACILRFSQVRLQLRSKLKKNRKEHKRGRHTLYYFYRLFIVKNTAIITPFGDDYLLYRVWSAQPMSLAYRQP